jgi:hypothetical protein
MTEFRSIQFGSTPIEISHRGLSVSVRTREEIRDHGTVEIASSGVSCVVDDFSFVTAFGPAGRRSDNSPLASLRIILPDSGWMALLGTLRLVVVNDASRTIVAPVQLYRTRDDDQGFYREKVHDCDRGVVVEYEGGLLLIRFGNVEWHIAKSWNETVSRVSTERIDIRGEDETGSIVSREISTQTGRELTSCDSG